MSTVSGDYEAIKATFSDRMAKQEMRGCKGLLELSLTVTKLWDLHDQYRPRPCLSGWPCVFTQHRTEIRKMIGSMEMMREVLKRQCEIDKVKWTLEGAIQATKVL